MRRTGEPAERRHFAVRDNDESGMGAAALKAALHRSELSRGGALALVDSVRTDQRVTASVTASPLLINRNSPASQSNSCLMLQWLNTLMPTPIRSRRLEHQAKTTAAAGSGVPLPAAADQVLPFTECGANVRIGQKLPVACRLLKAVPSICASPRNRQFGGTLGDAVEGFQSESCHRVLAICGCRSISRPNARAGF